ncbi:MAG: AAA family ATPase, partial [Candidatus Dependentiae bacterium]|nr:AAA family ATPase [Candidatus Dependentiae bacterium]
MLKALPIGIDDLNLSMLNYFFEKTEHSHAHLFTGSAQQGRQGLAIAGHADIMAHQGQYPVIFFTLKFIDSANWDNCFDKIKRVISQVYSHHIYLLHSPLLTAIQKAEFEAIIGLTASVVAYEVSLKNLTYYLSSYHNKNPIVLIDEYDVPVHAGFRGGYYDEVVSFIKSFFGDGIKNNNYLHFAVMTGALRIAKESIFTGMNNLKVCTFLSDFYADKFGLLEHEVQDMLAYYGLASDAKAVKLWYNGYTSGSYTVYNPWSIINLVDNKGVIQPYWVNTSTNDIIKKLIQSSGDSVKEDIELLIARSSITKEIRESIVYASIEKDETVLWNFLLFSGYLTFKNRRLIQEIIYVDLFIPNNEIASFFKSTVLSWFAEQLGEKHYNQMLSSLISGDIALFNKLFSNFVITSFSYFDITGNQPEKFYHAFVLGMLVSLADRYHVRSNRESGYGRYDVMLIPHDTTKVGIVIEFKKVD